MPYALTDRIVETTNYYDPWSHKELIIVPHLLDMHSYKTANWNPPLGGSYHGHVWDVPYSLREELTIGYSFIVHP